MEKIVEKIFIGLEDNINNMFNVTSLRANFVNMEFGSNGKYNSYTPCEFLTEYKIKLLGLSEEAESKMLETATKYRKAKGEVNHNPGDQEKRKDLNKYYEELGENLPIWFDLKTYVETSEPDIETYSVGIAEYDETLTRIQNELSKMLDYKTLRALMPYKELATTRPGGYIRDYSGCTANQFLTIYKIGLLRDKGIIKTVKEENDVFELYRNLLGFERALSYAESDSVAAEAEAKINEYLGYLGQYGLPIRLTLNGILKTYKVKSETKGNQITLQ